MVYSKKLSQFKDLVHGFTTKEEGDFRRLRGLAKTDRKKISPMDTITRIGDIEKLVLPEQVHGNKIAIADKRKVIEKIDGLITEEKEIVLGVTTADCLPILFYEPKEKIIAVVHAGWKGSLKKISQKAIQKIISLGGNPAKTIAAIGPHIKNCCYHIDEKRMLMFKKEFGEEVIIRKGNKFFLDLIKVNLIQLLKSGIKEENIEVLPFCTHCNSNLFFSFRKDKENYGEMLSFIGMVTNNRIVLKS